MTIIYNPKTGEMFDSDPIREFHFKDKTFQVTGCTAVFPHQLFDSFSFFENNIRDKWWNIEPEESVLDIGSAYGSYTFTALALGASLVIAIDPDRESYFDFETNLLLNRFNNRCLHLNLMLGTTEGLVDYYPKSHSIRPEGTPEKRIMTSVDNFIQSTIPVNWIKIDVEGSETDVLKSAEKTLTESDPKLLIENHICFDPTIPEQVSDYLIPFGYKEERDTSELGCWSLWEKK